MITAKRRTCKVVVWWSNQIFFAKSTFEWKTFSGVTWFVENLLDGSLKPTIPTTNIGLLVTCEEKDPCSSLSEAKFEVFVCFWYWWLIFRWTWLCVCKVCWLWCGRCWFCKKGPGSRFLFVWPQCRASVCPVSGNVSKFSVLKTFAGWFCAKFEARFQCCETWTHRRGLACCIELVIPPQTWE